MTALDGLLIALLFASLVIGLVIILIRADIISLKTSSRIKVLYSALIITLLLLFLGFSTKLLSTDNGQMWLDSFSNNGDCDKPNRPYWCEL